MAKNETFDGFIVSDAVEGGLNGYVVYQFENGDRYEGEFVNGKANGPGTRYSKDGLVAEGIWKDGKLCDGKVVFSYSDGSRYEGDAKDGKRSGYGKLYLANGDYYYGKFENNELVYGDYQNAEFRRCMKEGFKTQQGKTVSYKGDFKDLKYDGEGYLLESGEDGFEYQGEFKNGLFDGNGSYNGGDRTCVGKWKEGEFLG